MSLNVTVSRRFRISKPKTLSTLWKRHKSAKVDLKYDLYRLDAKQLPSSAELSGDLAKVMLEQMMYMRRMENKAAELYRAKLINGFCHLYVGQEAVAVGVKHAMQEKDTMLGTYRCHGYALLFGSTVRMVLAELMGRKTGNAKGKGGSIHMYGPQYYGGEGIVGGQVPVGTGLAFAHKYNGNGAVSFTVYGDGAASQGQIFESWNMAKLWNLPVVYICENNKFGMGTATYRHSANDKFYTRGDLIPGIKVNGMKVWEVLEAVKFAREFALKDGPIILEAVTYRYYGHSLSDPGIGYRTREEVKAVQEKQDPIKNFIGLLEDTKLMEKSEIESMRKAIAKDVDKQMEEAKKDEWPEISELINDVYVKPLEQIRGMVPWHKI